MNVTAVIAAVSTPPGKGGVAIIRMSGEGALSIAERVFVPKSGRPLSDIVPRMQVFGAVVSQGEEIDDGLITYFKAPNSYTGEDTVEISCHGGVLVTRSVLEALFAAGARPAEAGEFTRRALINGKISLTEAEAVGNLLEAKTHSQILLNTHKSRTLLSNKIEEIRLSLLDTLSSMYARIDYPDEDLGEFSNDELQTRLAAVRENIERLLKSYRTGRAVNSGIETVICGKPNAGKSSLYNLLLGEDAAIVTDIKGTTRDVLTAEVPLGKLLLRLSDTAGVRDGSFDEIEKIGIERTKRKIEESELVFAVFDGSEQKSAEDREIISSLEGTRAAKIAIINKCELEVRFPVSELKEIFDDVIEISVKCDPLSARDAISRVTDKLFTDEKIDIGNEALISNARQNAKLLLAKEMIESAEETLRAGLTQDLASSDIERALGEIAELDGKEISDEVLGDIFSKFCVGK